MTTFLLVRHAETDAIGRLISGRLPGWHLNRNGRKQAKRLAEKLSTLPLRAIYSSPAERAVETAEFIAAPHALSPVILEALDEVRFGAWEGLSFEALDLDPEWRRFNTCRSSTRPPGGELMTEVQARVAGQLEQLRHGHTNETIAVVSHGDPLRAAVACYLGISLDRMLRFEIGVASITAVQHDGCEWHLVQLNRTEEIPA